MGGACSDVHPHDGDVSTPGLGARGRHSRGVVQKRCLWVAKIIQYYNLAEIILIANNIINVHSHDGDVSTPGSGTEGWCSRGAV